MERAVLALGKEEEQVKTRHLVTLGGLRGKHGWGKIVEGLEMLDIAREGGGVAGADGGEGALLVEGAGGGEEVGRGGRRRGEGVEVEEVDLCAGEEGGGFGVGEGGGLELGDDLV